MICESYASHESVPWIDTWPDEENLLTVIILKKEKA